MTKLFKSCPLCGSINVNQLRGYDDHCLIKCISCHFIYDKRIPSEKELREYYIKYSYNSIKECSAQTINSYNKLLDKLGYYYKNGNILDYSCGQGDFLCEAKKRGWNVYGTEYSPAAINLCRSRGLNVIEEEYFQKNLFDIKFDVITSFEIIEHINNPCRHFDAIYKKLRHEGIYYCTTPNFNSIMRYVEKNDFGIIYYPEHLSYYTRSSISYVARRCNFRIKKIYSTGIDLGRLKNKIKNRNIESCQTETWLSAKAQTDDLRKNIERSSWLSLLKNIINAILSVTGTGDTLKGYFIKE